VAVLLVVVGCGDNAKEPDYLGYDWDTRRVLCSDDMDNLDQTIHPGFFQGQIEEAGRGGWALVLHAHIPTMTVSLDWLDQVLTWADASGLDYVTFRELMPGTPPHAGLALAFDDNTPDQWMFARDTLNKHGAHVTFFVSNWADMTPLGRQELEILHGDGHDVEPHSVHHLNAPQFVQQNGIDAYISQEVLPSFQVLIDAGYPPPVAYAYPGGAHTPEIDDAVLQHVWSVRTTPGECPWAGWDR
jgi:peptidoglycan/xylan/chitin deacetylase (PgdA/CDA1 family)